MAQGYWRTKEGLVLPISRLENSHLLNIINLLEKGNPSLALWLEYEDAPQLDRLSDGLSDWEEASSCSVKALNKLHVPAGDLLTFRKYCELVNEARRRQIIPV